MSQSPPQPPTRPSEIPDARRLILPDGIVSTGFPATENTCTEIGIRFDDWQRDLNRYLLAKDARGDYAADTVVLSIARQVGKTFDIGAVCFADSIIVPGTTTIWTAHRFKVSRESFNELRALARSPLLAPHIDYDDITTAAGNECIPFRNGSRIVFAARERGAIRGFTKVRRLVLDEAQILTAASLADLAPTMNQAINPQIILMGTPPKPSDPSEVFAGIRAEALEGKSSGVLYVELSADSDCDSDDRAAWRQANPSYPRRTSDKAIARLRKLLGADDFRREALGIWDEITTRAKALIESDSWDRLTVEAAPADGVVAYGVKFSPDGMTVALAAAVRPDAGPIHVEGIEQRSIVDGTRWLVEWLRSRSARIIPDGKAGAGALVEALRAAKVPAARIHRPTVDDVIAAHAGFVNGVTLGEVSHLADPAVSAAIASAGRRPIGNQGGWGFQSIDEGDVTLADALALAHWGASTAPRRTAGGRKVVVLS